MALHGTIKINGTTLNTWSAQRVQWQPAEVNEYRVNLYAPNGEGIKTGVLWHVYDDGAIALAAKVLAWAAEEEAGE